MVLNVAGVSLMQCNVAEKLLEFKRIMKNMSNVAFSSIITEDSCSEKIFVLWVVQNKKVIANFSRSWELLFFPSFLQYFGVNL